MDKDIRAKNGHKHLHEMDMEQDGHRISKRDMNRLKIVKSDMNMDGLTISKMDMSRLKIEKMT